MTRAALVLLVLLASPVASADHPVLEEGIRHYENVDFPAAGVALEAALLSDDLEDDDVLRALHHLALVHHATGQREKLRDVLLRLAQLDRGHSFSADDPPAVRDAFQAVVAGLGEPSSEESFEDVAASSAPGTTAPPPPSPSVLGATVRPDSSIARDAPAPRKGPRIALWATLASVLAAGAAVGIWFAVRPDSPNYFGGTEGHWDVR